MNSIGGKYLQLSEDGQCLDSITCGRFATLIGVRNPGKKPMERIASNPERQARLMAEHADFIHSRIIEMSHQSIGRPTRRLFTPVSYRGNLALADIITGSLYEHGECITSPQSRIFGEVVERSHDEARKYLVARKTIDYELDN